MSEGVTQEPLAATETEQHAAPSELVVREPGRALLAVAAGALIGLIVAVVALLPGMRIGRGRRWSTNTPLAAWRSRVRDEPEQLEQGGA